MANGSNFSILADVELDLASIQKQLKSYKITFDVDSKSINVAGVSLQELTEHTDSAAKSAENLGLTYQAARQMLDSTVDVISAMVEQVYELDTSLTEFKKVSDLSGASLDRYVSKLSEMGKTVARTGKPNRSEPGRWDGKPASRTAPKPLKASRALSLQHKDEIRLSVNVRNH